MIETLGEAFTHSVGMTMYCAFGPYTKSHYQRGRECNFSMQLCTATLVATRGRDFPLARVAERLRCPRCGSRQIRVAFDFARVPDVKRMAM